MVGLKLLGTSYLFNNNNCITNLWYLAIIFSIYTWFSWHCFTCYQINSQNGLQPSFHHFKLIEHFKLNPFDSSGNLVLQTLLSPIAIKVKHPTSNLSKQTVNAEIFLTLNSSFISIGQLCDDGCILKFDQHKIIIRKQHNYFWRLLGSSKRIMALLVIWTIPSQPTIQHKSKHKKTLVSTYQSNGTASYQGILPKIPTRISHFYHHILFCQTKCTLLQATNYGSFSTWIWITPKLLTKYLPESEIASKVHLDQQKQLQVAEVATNITPVSINTGGVLRRLAPLAVSVGGKNAVTN